MKYRARIFGVNKNRFGGGSYFLRKRANIDNFRSVGRSVGSRGFVRGFFSSRRGVQYFSDNGRDFFQK